MYDGIKIIERIQKRYRTMADEPYSRGRLLVDKSFHLEILEMGGNSKLLNIVDSIFDLLIVRRSFLHLSPGRPYEAYKEQLEIFEALKNRDGKKASRLMKEHIIIIKNFILDNLKNRQNGFKSTIFG